MESSVVSRPTAPINGEVRRPPKPRASRRAVLIAVAIIVVVAAVVAAWVATRRPASGIQASGTIEATESDVSPKVQGRLVSLRVQDGDRVRRGEVVATLEQLDPGLNLDQARANVVAAEAQVGAARAAYELQSDTYRTTLAQAGSGVGIAGAHLGQAGENLGIETRSAALAIDQAQAQLVAAQATYDRAQIDLSRAQSLVATGDEPRQSLDDANAAYASAAAQLQAARDAVGLAQAAQRNVRVRRLDVSASRQERSQSLDTLASAEAERALVAQRLAELNAADGALAQARAALGLARDQVHETQLVAPYDGYVMSHNFEVGDLVQPASAVLTVGDLDHPYVYVYVSETDLPHIKAGMHADVTIDGLPGRTFVGTVTEINNTAEFTPENVQTKEERIEYLVFRVKLQFYDRSGSLKPGLPVDATIHV